MKRVYCIITLSLFLLPLAALSATIDSAQKYGWGENLGWINFAPVDGSSVYHGLVITDTAITGYAWSETHGWINFSPTNGGVTNTCAGQLGGYAWSSAFGWIPMSGASINASGEIYRYRGIRKFTRG